MGELFLPTTSEERLIKFWSTLSKTLIKIYTSSMVTLAAIPGSCPAAGCCLALCCDFRIITANCSMGLNEVALGIPVGMEFLDSYVVTFMSPSTQWYARNVALGIPVPSHWIELMSSTIGQRLGAI